MFSNGLVVIKYNHEFSGNSVSFFPATETTRTAQISVIKRYLMTLKGYTDTPVWCPARLTVVLRHGTKHVYCERVNVLVRVYFMSSLALGCRRTPLFTLHPAACLWFGVSVKANSVQYEGKERKVSTKEKRD